MAIKLNDALTEINSLLNEAGIVMNWHKPRPLNPGMVADAATIRRIINAGLMRKARDLELFKGKSTEAARAVLVADGSHEEWLGMIKQSYIPVIAGLEKLQNAAPEGKVVPLSIEQAATEATEEVFQAIGEINEEAGIPAPEATVSDVQVSSSSKPQTGDPLPEDVVKGIEAAEAAASATPNPIVPDEPVQTERGVTEHVQILDDAGHFPAEENPEQQPEQDSKA